MAGSRWLRRRSESAVGSSAALPERTGRLAVSCSILSVLAVALIARVRGSPYRPALEPGRSEGEWLAAAGLLALVGATVAFLYALRAAWRNGISLRAVVVLAVAYHLLMLLLPLLLSRDAYSYAAYGRMVGLHHANPYVTTPAAFPRDPVTPLVGAEWRNSVSVYGPAFTGLSAGITALFRSVAGAVEAFRVLAALASLGTLALVAGLARRIAPDRAAFAVAAIGLNPVILFDSVAGGHADLLVGLSVAAALWLLLHDHPLAATVSLTIGALVKLPAAVPLVLLLAVVVSRAPRGRRVGVVLRHIGAVAGLTALATAPFLIDAPSSLGLSELATHEGWLAPSRFFHRVVDALAGGASPVGGLLRAVFAVALVAAVVLLALRVSRAAATQSEQGAAWGWGLLILLFTAPVLLPWYAAWILPIVWLLPRSGRVAILGTSALLTVSLAVAEPAGYPHTSHAMVFVGHYLVTPVVVGFLVWVYVEVVRRTRRGEPLLDRVR